MEQSNFTIPVICDNDGDTCKEWYVYFEYTHNGNVHQLKKRGGVNRIPTKTKRTQEIKALREGIELKLKNGWNPIVDPKFKRKVEAPKIQVNELSSMSFPAALNFALGKKALAKGSKSSYKTTAKYIKEAAVNCSLDSTPVSEIKRAHIKLLLEEATKNRKLTSKGYNKYHECLRALLGELIEWEAIESNPASKIKRKEEEESLKFVSYTDQEKKQLRNFLGTHYPRFFVYFMVLYHTGIRPKEILALKVKDIDLESQLITIVPDATEENAKTKKVRKVPINKILLPLLQQMELSRYDKNYYAFGSPFGPDNLKRKNCKGYKIHPDFFKPSPNRIKRDTVTKFWKKVVMDDDGLGIKKHLYAGKHTGADDKILAGIELDALRDMYGHSSKLMTEIYAKKVKEVYRKQIVENSPAF